MENKKGVGISLGMIKWVALIAMTLDHIGFFFSELCLSQTFREIGRISFPMFSFLIAYHLGQGVPAIKYLIRIGIFCGLSMIVLFGMVGYETYFYQLNVLGTLWFGILGIYSSRKMAEFPWTSLKPYIFLIVFILVALGSNYFGYEIVGFLYMLSFYYALQNQTILPVVFLLILVPFLEGFLLISSLVALITTIILYIVPVCKNQGIRLKWYWFYAYFPIHLGVLYGIKYLLG